MTNKEAIHELECNVDYKTPQIAQACKLAVRALEEQRNITNEKLYHQLIYLEAENERLHDALDTKNND